MAKKSKELQQSGSISVAPLTMELREKTIKENLQAIQQELDTRRKESSNAKELSERWDRRIALAEAKLQTRLDKGLISQNGIQLAYHLLDDARARRQSIVSFYINEPKEEIDKLMQAEKALLSLQNRLRIQRFREDFTSRTRPLPSLDKTTQVPSQDTLESIDRELRTYAHSIQALTELRS